MAEIINVNWYRFAVECDGWYGDEAARDTAINNLWLALRALAPEALAKMHAAVMPGDVAGCDAALSLCHAAVAPVVAHWHDRWSPALSLSAVTQGELIP